MLEENEQFGVNSLTAHEQDILRLLARGLTNREIAEVIDLTIGWRAAGEPRSGMVFFRERDHVPGGADFADRDP